MFDEINLSRRRFVAAAAMTIAATQFPIVACGKTWFGGASELDSLARATAWLNSRPLRTEDLQGRVVLFEFWTYSPPRSEIRDWRAVTIAASTRLASRVRV